LKGYFKTNYKSNTFIYILLYFLENHKKMISIIVGTNRKNSLSSKIALYYQNLLNESFVEGEIQYQIIDLADLPEDFAFSALYANTGKNEEFNELRNKVLASEKLVFIVPEYNGSFAGVLKTFIDGFPYPNGFLDKKIALVGLSAGIQGGVLALSHLTDIFSYLNANVLGMKVKLMQIDKNYKDAQITNDLYNELLRQQVEKFLAF
jgi:chromate reductase, NAD(P)H dehydrogenase (quinone)